MYLLFCFPMKINCLGNICYNPQITRFTDVILTLESSNFWICVHIVKKQPFHTCLLGQYGEKVEKSYSKVLRPWISYYHTLDVFMVFNATIIIISAILCRSILLINETEIPEEIHRPSAGHWQTLSYNVASPEWHSDSQR